MTPILVMALLALPVFAAAEKEKPHATISGHAPDPGKRAPAKTPPAKTAITPAPTDKPIPAKPEAPAASASPAGDIKTGNVKLAPRFAALRADKVYLRAGPSTDYPIQWVYVRKGLPVEILANFDIWRKIRDSDGTEGWVQQGMMTGRRSVLTVGALGDLRRDPSSDAKIVAKVEPGVIASVMHCDAAWCEIRAGDYRGWMKRESLWGLEPGETIP